MREYVCSLSYPACNAHAPHCQLWPLQLYNIFQHYLINGMTFGGGEVTEHRMCFLVFSTTFVLNTAHSKKNWPGCDQKCILVFMWSTRYCCPTLMKLEFSRYIFENYPNIEFHENSSSGSRAVPCGQKERRTDMTALIVAFRNFANPPKKCHWNKFCFEFRFFSCQIQSTSASYSPSSTATLTKTTNGQSTGTFQTAMLFRNTVALDRKVLSLRLKGLPGSDPTPPSQKNLRIHILLNGNAHNWQQIQILAEAEEPVHYTHSYTNDGSAF
jgi:hypothetical protein